jgi:hypothetical protein
LRLLVYRVNQNLLVDIATRKRRLTVYAKSLILPMTIHIDHGVIRLSPGEGRGVR